MVSSVVTGVLGLIYWIAAGRMFDAADVGRASALISTATMLGSLSCLSLDGVYERFLPLAGSDTRSAVLGGYLLSGAVALMTGAVFAWLPVAQRLLETTGQRLLFPVMVAVFTAFALTDPILTGLRRAPAVAAKNISFAVLKLLPIVLIGTGVATAGLVFSWTATAFAVTAVFAVAAVREAHSRRAVASGLPPARELLSYQGAFLAMMLVSIALPLALPLIVVERAGLSANAYFNLAWTMCSAAGLLRAAAGSAFIVEAVTPGADQAALVRKFAPLLGGLAVLTAAGLAAGGPLVLWLAGTDYLAAGWKLMLVMAFSSLVETVVTSYYLLAQLRRSLRLMVISQMLVVTVTLAAAHPLVAVLGITGAGVAYLAGFSLALLVVSVPLVRSVHEILAAPPPAPIVPEPDPSRA